MSDEYESVDISYIPALYLMDDDFEDDDYYEDEYEYDDRPKLKNDDWPAPPHWTWRRIAYLLIALIIILTFILYTVWPLLHRIANPPPPLPTPFSSMI